MAKSVKKGFLNVLSWVNIHRVQSFFLMTLTRTQTLKKKLYIDISLHVDTRVSFDM